MYLAQISGREPQENSEKNDDNKQIFRLEKSHFLHGNHASNCSSPFVPHLYAYNPVSFAFIAIFVRNAIHLNAINGICNSPFYQIQLEDISKSSRCLLVVGLPTSYLMVYLPHHLDYMKKTLIMQYICRLKLVKNNSSGNGTPCNS